MKSEIGEIVKILFYDLQPKKRLQLQRSLLIIINGPVEYPDTILNPAIYNTDGTLQNPPKRDYEFEEFILDYFKLKYGSKYMNKKYD